MGKEVAAQDVAQWMLEQVEKYGELYQWDAVSSIIEIFGEEFSYVNDNGNDAISPKVLAAFRKLSGNKVVWERSERLWRERTDWDEDSRSQG